MRGKLPPHFACTRFSAGGTHTMAALLRATRLSVPAVVATRLSVPAVARVALRCGSYRGASSSTTSSAAADGSSFIDRARTAGANALLGKFINAGGRFDRVLEGMRVTEVSDGRAVCTLPVTEGISNTYGTLHGGATATIIDVVGTLAILSKDPLRAGVSVDLNASYLSPAKVGDTVTCTGRLLKLGGKLAFTEVTIVSMATGKLVATGRHTKAL